MRVHPFCVSEIGSEERKVNGFHPYQVRAGITSISMLEQAASSSGSHIIVRWMLFMILVFLFTYMSFLSRVRHNSSACTTTDSSMNSDKNQFRISQ